MLPEGKAIDLIKHVNRQIKVSNLNNNGPQVSMSGKSSKGEDNGSSNSNKDHPAPVPTVARHTKNT